MDNLIIAVSAFTFLIFFFLHLVVFRRINKKAVIKWIGHVYAAAAIFPLAFMVYFRLSFLSFVLYTLMVAIYVIGFLGVMMTSVRIRLLKMIYDEGRKKGISKGQILRKYNRKGIIGNRLERLMVSDDLRFDGRKYHLGRHLSYFRIHNLIMSGLFKLYK